MKKQVRPLSVFKRLRAIFWPDRVVERRYLVDHGAPPEVIEREKKALDDAIARGDAEPFSFNDSKWKD